MKIGIMTYHRSNNYGAYLQAYALCARLNQEDDIKAELIDFRMKKEKENYTVRLKRSKRYILPNIPRYHFQKKMQKALETAIEEMTLSEEQCLSDDIADFQKMVYGKYDIIIAGSDEIWKVNGFRGFPTPYWLIGDLGCRKFSYAVSARVKFSLLSMEQLEFLKTILNDFEYISVRDTLTYEEVLKYCAEPSKVTMCCDPSFLYDFNSDEKNGKKLLRERYNIDNSKKCIGVMTGNDIIAAEIRTLYGEMYNLISLFHWHRGYINAPALSPFEWLDVIAGLDLVMTSYFHATCFSIINNIPFISFGTPAKSSKLIDLLNNVGLKECFIGELKEDLFRKELTTIVEHTMNSPKPDNYAIVEKQRSGFSDFLNCLRKN